MLPYITVIAILLIGIIIKHTVNLIQVNKKLSTFKCAPDGKFCLSRLLDLQSNTCIIPALMKDNQHGQTVKVNLGSRFPFLIVSDFKLLESILSSSKLIEKSQVYRYSQKWLGTGLDTSKAHKWFRMRKILTPTFHFQVLEQFVDVFNSASQILVSQLKENVGKKFDVYPFMTRYTLDIISETAMGTTVNAQLDLNNYYTKAVQDVTRIIGQRFFSFFSQFDLIYFFTKDYWIEDAAVKILHSYTEKVIKNRRQQIIADNENASNVSGKKRRLAFLDLLLQTTLPDGRSLTEEEIRDEVNTFMFAGHDTTATAISFALHCLAENIHIQDKIIEELHDIFADDKFRPITHADLQQMKYTEMVIKESLRLFPPVSMIAREVEHDEQIGEYTLPPNVPLVIFMYGIHRNPEIYPNPEVFDPERFTPDNQASRSPYSFIPFSAGPRNCIGQRFAMLEMKATLANILREFIILPVLEHKIVLSYDLVTKSSTGVYIQLQNRHF